MIISCIFDFIIRGLVLNPKPVMRLNVFFGLVKSKDPNKLMRMICSAPGDNQSSEHVFVQNISW